MKNKQRFFFHYNKPASKQAGRVRWSIHWRGTCYIVDHIVCFEPTESKVNKRQPYAVMQGFTTSVMLIHDNNGKKKVAQIGFDNGINRKSN